MTMPMLSVVSILMCFVTTQAAWAGRPATPPVMIAETHRHKEPIMPSGSLFSKNAPESRRSPNKNRRQFLIRTLATAGVANLSPLLLLHPGLAVAYTPDEDKLRESLYFISRVQEATVQQERLVRNAKFQEELKKKMKLSLRLVEKSYRLLDQINYASNFVDPKEEVVTASEAGNEAAEALQSAIDYVRDDLGSGPFTAEQRDYLTSALRTTREELFVFLKYMPPGKLREARLRVEDENVANRQEFDGDADAGVYNPVTLPWNN